MKKVILLLLIVLVVAQWWQKDQSIHAASSDVSFGYIVKYAAEAKKSDTLPLLIALHGNSDTPKNFYNTVFKSLSVPARIILIKGPIPRARGTAWPWLADEFLQYGTAFSEAVNALVAKYPTHGKPVLLGFSGGGMMAYYQALRHGNQYASIFPVSGQLSQEMLGDGLVRKGAKVYAFHGNSDSVIPISGAKAAIDILRKNGIYVELNEFNGGHHGIFGNMNMAITQAIEQKLGN